MAKKNKKRTGLISIVVVIIIVLAGAFLYASLKPKQKPVSTYTVKSGTVRPYVLASTSLYPNEYAELSFPVSGTITEVRVKPEQKVKKGEILAVLENEDLKDQLQNAKINLQMSEKKKAQTAVLNNSQLEQLKNQLESSKAQLDLANYNYDKAKKNYEDLKAQYDASPTPALKVQLDQAEQAFKQAEAQLKQAQSNYNQLLTNYNSTKTKANYDLNIASLSVEQARISANSQKRSADKLLLKAPYDGFILSVNLKVGDEAGGGGISASSVQGLTSSTGSSSSSSSSGKSILIAPLNWNPVASFYLDQVEIKNVKVGQRVEATLDSSPDTILKGKVIEKNIFPENTGSNVISYRVVAEFDERPETLYPGMSCTLKIFLEPETGFIVPVSAVRYINGIPYVYIVKPGNRIEQRKVKTGASDDEFVIVKSGVSEGEKVAKNVGELVISGLINVNQRQGNQGQPGFRGPFGR